MTITTLGAILGLVVAIILIIYKVPPVYGMMVGALVGGLVGGASLADTVSYMVSGASGMASGIMRIIAAGMLAGFLIKSGSAESIAHTIVKKMGEKYALLAGFTEIGETIEETVQREVMEEVGLKVKNIRYYKSQPWSFSDTILMGFYCDLDGEEEITLDREELALAEWFRRDEIPVEPSRDSLTNEMIIKFKNGEV